MRRVLITILAVCGVGACGQSEGTPQIDRDTLTRRQKDSIVSTMPLPGAARIRDAQEAVDRTRERAELLDSIGG